MPDTQSRPNLELETPDNSSAPLSILCDTESDYTDFYLLNADPAQLITGPLDAAFHRHRQFKVPHPQYATDESGPSGDWSVFRPVLTILSGQGADDAACRVIPQVICSISHGSRIDPECASSASVLKAKLYQAIQQVGQEQGSLNATSQALVNNNADIVRVLAELETHTELIAKAYARLVTDAPSGEDLPPDSYWDSAVHTEPGSLGAWQPNGYTLSSFSNPVGLIDSDDKLRMVSHLSFLYNSDNKQYLIQRGATVANSGRLTVAAAIPESSWQEHSSQLNDTIIGFDDATSQDRVETSDRRYYRPDDPAPSSWDEDTPLRVPASHTLWAYDVLMEKFAKEINANTKSQSFRQTAGKGYSASRVALRPLGICHMSDAERQYELSKGTVQYAILGDA